MVLSARFIRAQLKSIAEDAASADPVITLADALKSFRRGRVDATTEGLVVIATAGNGRSVTFQAGASLTPVDLTALGDTLEVRYDEAKARLIASGSATPSDSEILSEMLAKLQPVTALGVSDMTSIAK